MIGVAGQPQSQSQPPTAEGWCRGARVEVNRANLLTAAGMYLQLVASGSVTRPSGE